MSMIKLTLVFTAQCYHCEIGTIETVLIALTLGYILWPQYRITTVVLMAIEYSWNIV